MILLAAAANLVLGLSVGIIWYRGEIKLVREGDQAARALAAGLRETALIVALIIAGLASAAAVGAALFYNREIRRPVSVLAAAADRVAAGEYDLKIPSVGAVEFKELADRWNIMSDSLIHARYGIDKDSLTGLFNYRQLESFLRLQITQAARYKQPLTVAILDIDYFRAVNNTYGVLAGDQVLRAAARFIKTSLREADFVARYGGEEFFVVMPESGLAGARLVMQRIIRDFPRHVFVDRPGLRHRLTVSVGVAAFPGVGETLIALMSAADTALRAAKQGGRDRLVDYLQVDQA